MDGKEKHGKDPRQGAHQQARPQAGAHDDIRLIVRIAGIDLDGKKPIYRAMTKIRGIGVRMSKNIAVAFENATGIPSTKRMGDLNEEQAKKLEEVVQKPASFGIPVWNLNKRRDFYTGTDSHLVMSEWDLALRSDLSRMTETKSYKGLRHIWGLPVRGQRTKSTHRGKGTVVGVLRKDAMAQAKPAAAAAGAKPAAGAPKKDEKKK